MRWLPVHPWKAGLVCLAAAAGLAHAGDIYKSLDANGNVSYSDHADPSKTQTPVVLPEDPRYPPRQMHVCGTRNCFTLMLDNGSYRRADGTDDTWTIESFTPRSVVLRRHGAITGNTDVTYSGDVVNDRLVNVRVNGAVTGGIDASWGAALNTLPGNHAEPDASSPANGDNSLDGGLSTAMAPPPIPPEDQPEIPEPGYLWTPGYWYWRNHVYSWVPGTWLRPPQTGFFWTPGYWRLVGTLFVFRPGYWGPSVGFYGGINYGHGYGGTGYTGARWMGGSLAYNRGANRLSAAIKSTYPERPPNPGSRPHVVAAKEPSSSSPTASSSVPPPKINRARPIRASAPKS